MSVKLRQLAQAIAAFSCLIALEGTLPSRGLAQDTEAAKDDSAKSNQQVDDPSSSTASAAPSTDPAPELLAPTNTLETSAALQASDEKSEEDATKASEEKKPNQAITDEEASSDAGAPKDESGDQDDAANETDSEHRAAAVENEDGIGRKVPPPAPSPTERGKSRLVDRASRGDSASDSVERRGRDTSGPTRSIVRPSPRATDAANRRQTTERRAYRVDPDYDRRLDVRSDDEDLNVAHDDASPETLPAPGFDSEDDRDRHAGRPIFGIYLRQDSSDAAVVEEVAPRSPAARAGVRVDDVVIALDGENVRSLDDFYDIAQRVPKNGDPTISVSRTFDLRLRTVSPEATRPVRTTVYDPAPAVPLRDRTYLERRPPARIYVPAPENAPRSGSAERTDRENGRREGGLLRGRLFGR